MDIPQVKDEIYLYSRAGIQLTRLAVDFVGVASIANRRYVVHHDESKGNP